MKKYIVVYDVATPSEQKKVSRMMTPEEINKLTHRDDVRHITVNYSSTQTIRLKGSD